MTIFFSRKRFFFIEMSFETLVNGERWQQMFERRKMEGERERDLSTNTMFYQIDLIGK